MLHLCLLPLTPFEQGGVKLPPIAARQLREEARDAAIEKLSARRADADRVSITMVVDVMDEPSAEHPSSHRSSSSHQSDSVGVPVLREDRVGQGFISPEYGDDFEPASDAVAHHVNAFMSERAGDAGNLEQGHDDDAMETIAVIDVSDPPPPPFNRHCVFLITLPG